MKSWLAKNGIEMYSMHNEGKSVAVEESSRTLKKKMYKYMTSISKIYRSRIYDPDIQWLWYWI